MTTEPGRGTNRRRMIGVVKSDKMTRTVVVVVTRKVRDPLYRKYVNRRASFAAHDEREVAREGDLVEIQEHRPVSATKRWKVIRVVRSGALGGRRR
ncbi:MAG: 30S ribosomal protein S17 [Myxococcota bacterium]|nr:30S ribosomal protein S17 [Myxococcota bacterium]